MVEVLRSPSFVLSDSEDGPDVSSRFMRLDLSSLKEDQRIQHEKSQKPQEERTAEQQAQRSNFQHQLNQWQWENGDIPSGAATPKAKFLEPRRAFSTTEQLSRAGTQTSFVSCSAASRPLSPIPSPREPHNNMTDSYFQTEGRSSAATVPVSPGYARQIAFLEGAAPPRDNVRTAFGKPILPGPQRSYSVMDYEPVPFTHQPGAALLLVHLPPELHYAIFDFLEPLDSTAFALTSKHFYIIHRQMHGKVSLATRRSGPNDMEWVWRNAGPFIFGGRNGGMAIKHNALAELSPRGQVYCRKCRTARCELRNHIRDFFPADTEYCEITQKYGALAQPGAKPVCCRSSPRHPHRCGRHTRQQRAVRLS